MLTQHLHNNKNKATNHESGSKENVEKSDFTRRKQDTTDQHISPVFRQVSSNQETVQNKTSQTIKNFVQKDRPAA